MSGDFKKEYYELLKKYNAKLIKEIFKDEYGIHESIYFKSKNEEFFPQINTFIKGYCGIGS